MPDQWYIKTTNGKRGPYSKQQLQRYIDAGALRPNAGIGDAEGQWIAAVSLAGLDFPAEVLAQFQTAKRMRAAKSSGDQTNVAAASQNAGSSGVSEDRGTAKAGGASEEDQRQSVAELETRSQFHEEQASELNRRAGELESKASQLDDRETVVADAEEQLLAERDELQTKLKEFEHQASELENRITEIKRAEDEVQQRARLLDDRSTELDERAETLASRERGVSQHEKTLEESGTMLAEREIEIGNRQTEVSNWQREVETMRSSMEVADSQKRDAEGLVERFEQTIGQLESELDSLRAELEAQTSQINVLRAQSLSDQSASSDEPTASDDAAADRAEVLDELVPTEKKRLLQKFAARQESLSRREAELIRREDELKRRELDIRTLAGPPEDASVSDQPSSRTQSDGDARPEPAEKDSDAELDSAYAPLESEEPEPDAPSDPSIDHVLNAVTESPAELAPELPHESDHERATVSVAPAAGTSSSGVSLIDLRRQTYEQRFGPCTRYDVDDDTSMQVDVSVHLPSGTRDFATLVTSGMSDYPIPMPNGQRSVHAELLMYATHLDEHAIKILRGAAKVPFQKKQGLSIGTTGSLDELKELLSGGNQQDCVYMLPVIESDSKPISAKQMIGSSIQLFWLLTITEAERKLIETSGIHKFLSLLEKNNHAVFFDLTRDCYVKRKGWFRR